MLVGLAVYVARKLGVEDTDTLAVWFVLSPVFLPVGALGAISYLLLILPIDMLTRAVPKIAALLERVR